MTFWKHIWHLLRIGFLSLFESNNGIVKNNVGSWLTFVGVPLAIGCGCLFWSISAKAISNDILTTLSIFLAIALGVIFIVPDKLVKKVEGNLSDNESKINYLGRYKNFCKLFIRRLTFVLVLSVFLIIISVLLQMIPPVVDIYISAVVFMMFTLAILSILKLVIDIYGFLMEEINKL